jgi:hypothetical protein
VRVAPVQLATFAVGTTAAAWPVAWLQGGAMATNPFWEHYLAQLQRLKEITAPLRELFPANNDGASDAVTIQSTNDARDEWLYEQKKAGATLVTIRRRLTREHPEWEPLKTDQAIGKAIDRYCDRKELSRLRRK